MIFSEAFILSYCFILHNILEYYQTTIYYIIYNILLHYIILYLLYIILLYYIILYYMKLYYIILYDIILYYIYIIFFILYYITLYYILYYIILYYIILYYIILYYIILYYIICIISCILSYISYTVHCHWNSTWTKKPMEYVCDLALCFLRLLFTGSRTKHTGTKLLTVKLPASSLSNLCSAKP